MHLGGWRRLGVVVWALWLFAGAALGTYEWTSKISGIFVYRYLLAGTTLDVMKNEATMPDGRKVPLTQSLALLKPWEVDWDKEPEVARALLPNWKRFLKLAFALPAFVWVVIELGAAAFIWVARGFRPKNAA